MIRVVLAEDHKIVRNGIKMLLESDDNIEIVGEAVNGIEVLKMIESGIEVDVVLADINMPELDGISLIAELKKLSPKTQIVMLSMFDNEKYVAQAFHEGATGYLMKNVSADELIFSIKHVDMGGKYLCSELALRLLDKLIHPTYNPFVLDENPIEFSMREIEILHLLAEGFTNQEISEKLFISKRTVEGHRQNLIEKTQSKNTASLIRFAILNGVIH